MKAVGRFEVKYEAVYGRGAGFREAGVELSTFRVQAIGRTRKPSLSGSSAVGAPRPRARDIFEPSAQRWISASVWDWLELPAGYSVRGPAVIEHPETTVYVGASQTAVLDNAGNVLIELSAAQS